jgi:hypothetical protein
LALILFIKLKEIVMRTKIMLLFIISLLLISCFDPPVTANGTLNFNTSINEDLAKIAGNDTCQVLVEDLIWKFASFEISTDRIIEGAPDTLEWIQVYFDTTESRLSEFEFEAELPVGTYRSLRLAMRNRNWWLCDWDDSLVRVEDWNRSPQMYGPEEASYSYYDYQGCWYVEEAFGDTFYNVAPDESISDIMIYNGTTVNITMNWNLYQIKFTQKTGSDSLIAIDWFIREGHDMIEWNISSVGP